MTSRAALLLLALAAPPIAGPAMPQWQQAFDIVSRIGDKEFIDAASRVSDSASVRLVRISTLMGAEANAERLATSEERNWRAVKYLQLQLKSNWEAMRVIRSSNIELSQIVWLVVAGDGSAILYADDVNAQ